MLDSISNLFSQPYLSRNKYTQRPSFQQQRLRAQPRLAHRMTPFADHNLGTFVECLGSPIEEWILQQ